MVDTLEDFFREYWDKKSKWDKVKWWIEHRLIDRISDVKYWLYYRFHPKHRYNIIKIGPPAYYDPDQKLEQAMIRSGVDQTLFEAATNAALGDGYVKPDDRQNICFVLAVEGRRLNGYRLTCKSILDESPWASPIWWALKKVGSARSTSEVVTIALRLYRRLQ
jgi:hypothetical protein